MGDEINQAWSEEFGRRRKLPEGPDLKSLWQLVQEYDEGELLLAPHQRAEVWDAKKQKAWIRDLQNGILPIGCFITYQLETDRYFRIYLNDGSQRLRATMKWYANPSAYDDTKADVIHGLKALRIIVQHRIYQTTDEAMKDFYRINSGTKCTAYEFMDGVLGYLDDYETLWKSVITDIHDHVQRGITRSVGRDKFTRITAHKFLRDDYALFLRFLTGDKAPVDYPSSESDIELRDIESGKVMEFRLRERFEKLGYDTIRREVDTFGEFIGRETTNILKVWQDYLASKGRTEAIENPNVTLYRGLLATAIWRRNNNIPINRWVEFLEKVFNASDGDSQFTKFIDGNRMTRANFRLSGLSRLATICKVIDSDFYVADVRQRSSRKNKPGVDNSHVDAFATNGNGPTVRELASTNRARGAQPISISDAEAA